MEPVDLLLKNLGLFQKIKETAQKQLSFLHDNKIDAFQALSLQRQRLQQEISRYRRKYGTLIRDITEHPARTRLRDISLEIAEVIRSIGDIDLKSEEFILKERDAVLMDMKKLRKGQKTLKGYGRKTASAPRFIDRKS